MLRRPLLAVALAVGLVFAPANAAPAQEPSKHLALGKPSAATADKENPDPKSFLMIKEQFALSYNSMKGTPNWVSWRLVKEDSGDTERTNKFHPDPDLPKPFFQVKPSAYDHSGFDRGHMCPNADRDVNEDDAKATFVMTNMVPQSGELNRQSWGDLEDFCRRLAMRDKELYIVAGPSGKGGWGLVEKREKGKVVKKSVFLSSLADGKITVPALCWKVVLVIERGEGAPAKRVTKESQVFAVVMHNDLAPKDWRKQQVSIDDVEKLTGYQFFTEVPADIIGPLKKQTPLQVDRFDPTPSTTAWRGEALPFFRFQVTR